MLYIYINIHKNIRTMLITPENLNKENPELSTVYNPPDEKVSPS